MSTPFLGQIKIFAGNFAPQGWALCNGQILPISQYDALFVLLGTTYGGDGQTTFALPNLQGRLPIHAGQGPSLSNYSLGQTGGTEMVTLTSAQIASHTHALQGTASPGTSTSPAGLVPAGGAGNIYGTATPTTGMYPGTVGTAGSSSPHDNTMPFLVINYIIALQGIFPSRN